MLLKNKLIEHDEDIDNTKTEDIDISKTKDTDISKTEDIYNTKTKVKDEDTDRNKLIQMFRCSKQWKGKNRKSEKKKTDRLGLLG